MERISFLKSIRAIAEAKKCQLIALSNKGEDGSVEYSILREEMEDALAILEASKKGDNELQRVIYTVTGYTTSRTILDTCDNFLSKC